MKKKSKNRSRRPQPPQEFELYESPLNNIDTNTLKTALINQARESKEKFPKLINSIIEKLKTLSPLQIISTISIYGLQIEVKKNGVLQRNSAEKIEQHHVELLQALALTINLNEWGTAYATPSEIQSVIDETKELCSAFSDIRYLAMEQELDSQARTVLSLQERLRGHTQIVRNWGYHSSVVSISKELYSPLDNDLKVRFGFSATDLIETLQALIKTLERKASERWRKLSGIFKARKIPELVQRYYSLPEIEGDPQEYINNIPKHATLEMVKGNLLAHADLNLPDMALVDIDELAREISRSTETVELVLRKTSMQPGALATEKSEHFFLNNPAWTAPGLMIEEEFYFPAPQIAFSHINSIIRSLVETAGLQESLKDQRARYLERKITDTVKKIFPHADVSNNAKWKLNNEQFETDLLCQVGRAILIIECKSATLTPQGLRGAPERVKRHVRDLIVDPAEQSFRLEQIINKAKKGDAISQEVTRSLNIKHELIDTIVRISVTLDDLSVICNSEKDFKKIGWAPENLRLAPTLNIADFGCIVEILSEPAYFLHYFSERERIQKTMEFLGDELDLLGLYLETGFNIGSIERQKAGLAISGMSAPIDHYFTSLDAGVLVRKPRPKLHPYINRLVLEVQKKANRSWTTVVLDLLRMGSPHEQKIIFQALEKLRKNVKKNYNNPRHLSSLIVSPPEHRESSVIFYVYPKVLSRSRRENVKELAHRALTEQRYVRCIVVSREIESWNEAPYQAIAMASLPVDPSPASV